MLRDNNYRLSRWCNWFENHNQIAFFHSLNFELLFVPKAVGNKIIHNNKEVDASLLQEFSKAKLLVNHDHDDSQELVTIRNSFLKEKSLEIMYLILADACNLKCSYCFEETPLIKSRVIPPNKKMDIDTVNKSIDVFAKLTSKYGRNGYKRVIHLYGGEPLLNIEGIKAAVKRVEKLKEAGKMPDECEIAIITNGVLLDENIIRFFAKHKISVGISIDGPADINNIHRRPRKQNSDMFSTILRNYRLLQKYRVKNGISATLTPEVIENFDEVSSFFIDELGIQDGISFNILHYNPAIFLDENYFDNAAQCLIESFKRFRELGIYEERMMRKAKAFIDQKPMFSDCGAMGNQIVVAPDGMVGMCQDFVKPRTYFDYSIFQPDFDPYNLGLFKNWEYRSPLFMNQCIDCEAVGICGGGCPASAELKTGSIWSVDDRVCPHSKKSLNWLIWDTFFHINSS